MYFIVWFLLVNIFIDAQCKLGILKGFLMQGAYGGLICILIYGAGFGAVEEEFALLTENDIFILTELSQEIET
jgi:hypothetical protein